MLIVVEIVKMAALAALVAMIFALLVSPFVAAIIGVATLWALVVKASGPPSTPRPHDGG